MNSNSSLISLDSISFGYSHDKPVFQNLNFSMNKGQRIGLIGANGSGKTTLLHIIMGLLKPFSGEINLFGENVKEKNDFRKYYGKIGLLFQDSDDQLFNPTVLEDVAFGPLNMGKSKEEAMDISLKTLRDLGIYDFRDRITHKLSGGEKRLVAMATLLSMRPKLLLLDEPATGLDENIKNRLADILSELSVSYIIISHDSEFTKKVTNQTAVMENGNIFLTTSLPG